MELTISDAQIVALVRHAAKLNVSDVKVYFDDNGMTMLGTDSKGRMNLGEVFVTEGGFRATNLFKPE